MWEWEVLGPNLCDAIHQASCFMSCYESNIRSSSLRKAINLTYCTGTSAYWNLRHYSSDTIIMTFILLRIHSCMFIYANTPLRRRNLKHSDRNSWVHGSFKCFKHILSVSHITSTYINIGKKWNSLLFLFSSFRLYDLLLLLLLQSLFRGYQQHGSSNIADSALHSFFLGVIMQNFDLRYL